MCFSWTLALISGRSYDYSMRISNLLEKKWRWNNRAKAGSHGRQSLKSVNKLYPKWILVLCILSWNCPSRQQARTWYSNVYLNMWFKETPGLGGLAHCCWWMEKWKRWIRYFSEEHLSLFLYKEVSFYCCLHIKVNLHSDLFSIIFWVLS